MNPFHPQPFQITPRRTTQPYRQGTGRLPGQTLAAMLAGQPQGLPNPMDARRQVQRQAARPMGSPQPGSLADLLSRLPWS